MPDKCEGRLKGHSRPRIVCTRCGLIGADVRPAGGRTQERPHRTLDYAPTHDDRNHIVLAYVLVSMGVIITFLLAVFVIGWFIGRLRERRRGQRGEE